jgi:hypothetical protein
MLVAYCSRSLIGDAVLFTPTVTNNLQALEMESDLRRERARCHVVCPAER